MLKINILINIITMIQCSIQKDRVIDQNEIEGVHPFKDFILHQICDEIKNYVNSKQEEGVSEENFVFWALNLLQKSFLGENKEHGIYQLISLLEHFPYCDELYFKLESIRTGYFIQLVRILFFDDAIEKGMSSGTNYSDKPDHRTSLLEHIKKRFYSKIDLFENMSSKMFKNNKDRYWTIEDVPKLTKKIKKIPLILFEFFKKEELKDYLILISGKIPDDVDLGSYDIVQNEDEKLFQENEAYIDQSKVVNEETDETDNTLLVQKESYEKTDLLDEQNKPEPIEFIMPSSFLFPYIVKVDEKPSKIKHEKFVETALKRKHCQQSKISKKGTFKFSEAEAGVCLDLILNIFEFLTVYFCENVKVKINYNLTGAEVEYIIDDNVCNIYPDNNTENECLKTLNSISHIMIEEYHILINNIFLQNNNLECNIVDRCNSIVGKSRYRWLSCINIKKKDCFKIRNEKYVIPSLDDCLLGFIEDAKPDNKIIKDNDDDDEQLNKLFSRFIYITRFDNFKKYSKEIRRKALEEVVELKTKYSSNLILQEYFDILKDSENIEKDIKVYTKKYRKCCKEVEKALQSFGGQDEVLKLLNKHLKAPVEGNECYEIKLILTLALYNNLTYKDLIYRTIMPLRDKIIVSENKRELAYPIINALKLKQLKYSFFVKLCMREALLKLSKEY